MVNFWAISASIQNGGDGTASSPRAGERLSVRRAADGFAGYPTSGISVSCSQTREYSRRGLPVYIAAVPCLLYAWVAVAIVPQRPAQSRRDSRKSATVCTRTPYVFSGWFMKAPKSFRSPVNRWVAPQGLTSRVACCDEKRVGVEKQPHFDGVKASSMRLRSRPSSLSSASRCAI